MTVIKKNKVALPNLLIIGAMKAGTSSLHNYLSIHPDIFMSHNKELNFFNTSLNWDKGLDWYKSQFNSDYKVRGESSPNYSKWEDTAERIFDILPNAKLIYVVRDPVARFVSECNHQQMDPNQMVDDLRNGEDFEIFTNGLYYKWYGNFLKYYSKNKILLLKSENLLKNREHTLRKIFQFLEVNEEAYDFNSDALKEKSHMTKDKPIASEDIKKLNTNPLYRLLKQLLRPIKPLFKPLQQKLFYKKRIIRDLSSDNKQYLKERYKLNLRKLEKETGITF